MLAITLAIVVSTLVGAGTERRYGKRARDVSRRMLDVLLWILLPPIAFLAVVRLDFGGGVGVGLGLAYVELAVVGTLAWLAGTWLLRLPPPAVGALIIAVVLANTGYLGLPLAAALLGTDALGTAIVFDQLVSGPMVYLGGFAVGAAFGTRAGEGWRARLRTFFTRNPVLPAVVLGFIAPEALAPEVAIEIAGYVVIALLPVGFFVLGVNLATESRADDARALPAFSRPVAVALVLRMGVAPALLLLASVALVRLPDAYLLQAAMPSGINGLVVAHAYGLDLRVTAGAIAWTTVAAVAGGLVAAAVL
jgi:predicted permease